jgi:hypothetical protein
MNANGIIFVAGLVAVALGIYVINKKNKKPKIKEFWSDEEHYNEMKCLIDNYIQKKEWDKLELFLDSSVKDFPDLIEKIEDALKNRSKI